MKFQHYDLGHQPRGAGVTVELSGSAANVRLVDDVNLARYRRRSGHQYVGGYFTQSPVRLAVPSAGRWHIVIDLGGRSGHVSSNVSVAA